jgi:hypothetical protein
VSRSTDALRMGSLAFRISPRIKGLARSSGIAALCSNSGRLSPAGTPVRHLARQTHKIL